MTSWMKEKATACFGPVSRYGRMNRDDDDDEDDGAEDAQLWFRDLAPHSLGEFSFAVVRGNPVLEDQSQVETCRNFTFLGVYDGHGGPEASQYVIDRLFPHFSKISLLCLKLLWIVIYLGFAGENGAISEVVLRNAIGATEDGFLNVVREIVGTKPSIVAVGSCCLVGVLWKGTLHIANLGDSRAVMGVLNRFHKIVAEPLTSDHNACSEEIRRELRSQHPEDPHILVQKNGVWRIKGVIQVSRAIGDAHLKSTEFVLDPSIPRYQLNEPLTRPVLSAEPSIHTRVIGPRDKFLIFASDGLWDHLTNQEAAELVHKYPRAGIAKKLIKKALKVAAKKQHMTYTQLLQKRPPRRQLHDDITVIVLFFDRKLLDKQTAVQQLSVHGFMDNAALPDLSFVDGINTNQVKRDDAWGNCCISVGNC
ncbi:hypothetical protein Sjap_012750 [Stephania japonica]|uniref:protein-serine/threonine phosphatase n=1 Tax=Stephania japonica TaxID=461633 RepID=A0AAP0IWQ7_9MAGN